MDARDEKRSGAEAPPNEDELLAMAYADGELGREEAEAFTARLASDPSLVQTVAEHRALQVLGRMSVPPEPADHDWSRLQLDPVFRLTHNLGWSLLVLGLGLSLILAIWGVATNDALSVLERTLILGSLAGFLLLFLTVLWRRLRAYPLDPYRHVER